MQYICGLYQHYLRATTVLWRKNNTVAQLADLSEIEKLIFFSVTIQILMIKNIKK